MSSDRTAQIEITASSRKLMAGLGAATRKVTGWAASAARGVGAAFSKIKMPSLGKVGKSALGNFGGDMLTRGFDAVTDAAQGVRDFERGLIRFQIASKGTAASTAKMRAQIRAVSRDTGVAADDILAGASQYVALTGDSEGAAAAMSSFARIAQASGSSVADVASATAALRTSMGLNANEIEDVFSSMIVQGKEGAVELKDLAGELATLAPQFAQFRGGKSVSGIRELGAAFQVIRSGAGTAGEAATQLESVMGELANPEVIRKLGKLKVKIFDKDPKTGIVSMRNASDIFEDLAKNQKLADPRVLATVFGRKEAQQAIRSMQQHIDQYRDLRSAAEDTGAVQRDLNTFLESDAGRLDKAMNTLKVSIAEAFTPERIHAFTGAIEKGVGFLDKMLGKLDKIGEFFHGDVSKMIEDWEKDPEGSFDKLAGDQYAAPYKDMSAADREAAAQQLGRQGKAMAENGMNPAQQAQGRGMVRAADQLRKMNDAWSADSGASLDPVKAVAAANNLQMAGGGAVGSGVEMLLKQAVEQLRKLNASNSDIAAQPPPKVEVGRKEVTNAYKDSAQHGRSPRV